MKYRPGIRCHLITIALLGGVLWAQTGGRPADDSRSDDKSKFPIPSGEYGIGRRTLDLTDNAHPEVHLATLAKHRELMVYIWYPAQHLPSKSHSEYFPFAAEIDENPKFREVAQDIFGASWTMIVDGSLQTHAIPDTPIVAGRKFPVILFFPGYSSTTFSYIAQIESLVSHGYVVVAVEDTNGSGMVRFSDGRIELLRSPSPPDSPSKDPLQTMIASAQQGTQAGAEQVRYILDVLKKTSHLPTGMDFSRVAVIGHSVGGTLAARACQLDSQITVCMSEDGEVNPVGAFFDYPDQKSMQQPFLLIQIEQNPTDEELARMHESRSQWNEFLAHEYWQLRQCGKGSYFVQLHRPGMGHSVFSDGPILNARDNEQAATVLENLRLTEELEIAFLDKNLKGAATSIFDQTFTALQGVTVQLIDK